MNYYDEMNKVPEHLKGIGDVVKTYMSREVDEKEAADIAFTILALEGDKAAIKKVAEYIRKQNQNLRWAYENHNKFANDVFQWVGWAVNWTMRKPGNT